MLDPRNTTILAELAIVTRAERRYAAADRYYWRIVEFEDSYRTRVVRAFLQIQWRGSTSELRALLESRGDLPGYELEWAYLLELERDYRTALDRLPDPDPELDPARYVAIQSSKAHFYRLLGDPDRARQVAIDTIPIAEALVGETGTPRTTLGRLLALTGRREDAIRAIDQMLSLVPPDKYANLRAHFLRSAAEIHVILDEPSEALDYLERRMAMDGRYTAHELELEPIWDPLRDEPRFRELLVNFRVEP